MRHFFLFSAHKRFPEGKARSWAASFGKMLAFFREGVDFVDTLRPGANFFFMIPLFCGLQQLFCIGLLRVVKELIHGIGLHHSAMLHHNSPVTDLVDHIQIV